MGLSPRDCVGVEDARAGISAIHAAGMVAIGIGSEEALPDADLALLPGSRTSFAPKWSGTASVGYEWDIGGNLRPCGRRCIVEANQRSTETRARSDRLAGADWR